MVGAAGTIAAAVIGVMLQHSGGGSAAASGTTHPPTSRAVSPPTTPTTAGPAFVWDKPEIVQLAVGTSTDLDNDLGSGGSYEDIKGSSGNPTEMILPVHQARIATYSIQGDAPTVTDCSNLKSYSYGVAVVAHVNSYICVYTNQRLYVLVKIVSQQQVLDGNGSPEEQLTLEIQGEVAASIS